jgi:ArsR family transcriptional regulator
MSKYCTKDLQRVAQQFAALSNPNRAAIFVRLVDCCCGTAESCSHDAMRTCVGDLGKDLSIAASTVSHHIKELHRAGLIKLERCGRTVRCCVDTKTVKELAGFLNGAAVTRLQAPVRKPKRAR